MAEQYCSQVLDSVLKLVRHSRSSILTFCVLHFTFSLVATLGNLLVIRALIKASTIPANVRKMFISLAFSDLAVGLLPQLMDAIIYAVVWKTTSRGDNLAFLCPTVLSVLYYFMYLLVAASFLNVIFITFDRLFAVSFHLRYQELVTAKTSYNSVGVCMDNKLRLRLPTYFLSKRNWNGSCGYFPTRIYSNYRGICSNLQSCQISSESDLQSKSTSKCPNKRGTPTKEVRLQ